MTYQDKAIGNNIVNHFQAWNGLFLYYFIRALELFGGIFVENKLSKKVTNVSQSPHFVKYGIILKGFPLEKSMDISTVRNSNQNILLMTR